MKRLLIGAVALLSISAHAENFVIDCEGHHTAYLSIAQGEHSLAIIGNPTVYKYTAEDEHYAVKNHPDSMTKRLEMFFPVLTEEPDSDNQGCAAISTHNDGEIVMVLPDGVKLYDCKVKIDDLLGGDQ